MGRGILTSLVPPPGLIPLPPPSPPPRDPPCPLPPLRDRDRRDLVLASGLSSPRWLPATRWQPPDAGLMRARTAANLLAVSPPPWWCPTHGGVALEGRQGPCRRAVKALPKILTPNPPNAHACPFFPTDPLALCFFLPPPGPRHAPPRCLPEALR